MVDVVTQTDFEELKIQVQAIDARLVTMEANMKVMPDTVKAALKTVLAWMDANV